MDEPERVGKGGCWGDVWRGSEWGAFSCCGASGSVDRQVMAPWAKVGNLEEGALSPISVGYLYDGGNAHVAFGHTDQSGKLRTADTKFGVEAVGV